MVYLPWCLEFGIDTESEGSIAINLLPLVEPSYQFSLAENKSQNNSARFVGDFTRGLCGI